MRIDKLINKIWTNKFFLKYLPRTLVSLANLDAALSSRIDIYLSKRNIESEYIKYLKTDIRQIELLNRTSVLCVFVGQELGNGNIVDYIRISYSTRKYLGDETRNIAIGLKDSEDELIVKDYAIKHMDCFRDKN